MRKALIIGGTGQVGMAVAFRLTADGWHVALAARRPPATKGPWEFVPVDRTIDDEFMGAVGQGADLLLDCIAFDEFAASQLLTVQDRVGHLMAISSASVYCDSAGKSIDEASVNGFPEFPIPLSEDHTTVRPGPDTYSTRKVAMEQKLLNGATRAVTILRPCAIHGPFSKHAREWWVLKRLLDGRESIPLAYRGESQFQTTSTRSIADVVALAAEKSIAGIINVVDGDSPTTNAIARTIMEITGRKSQIVGLPSESYPPKVGMSPWSVQRSVVCSSQLPIGLTYRETVPAAVDWLLENVANDNWKEQLPQLAAYPWDQFDYHSEDERLCALD